MKHSFSSPLSRDLFALGVEATQELLSGANRGVPMGEPDADFDRWCDAREGEKPVTLPTGDPHSIQHELDALERKRFVGRPHEI